MEISGENSWEPNQTQNDILSFGNNILFYVMKFSAIMIFYVSTFMDGSHSGAMDSFRCGMSRVYYLPLKTVSQPTECRSFAKTDFLKARSLEKWKVHHSG